MKKNVFSKELDKRLNRENRNQTKKKPHTYKDKYVFKYWILFPLVLIVKAIDDYKSKKYNALTFNDTQAEAFLNKVFPKICDIEENSLVYCCQRRSSSKLTKKEKAYWNKFSTNIINYINNDYTIEGYTKKIEKDYYDTWIIFIKN